MRKKRILAFLFILIIMGNVINIPIIKANSLEINAKSALLMEPTTGTILFEQNAHESLRPASVTKIMTLLLIYEALEEGKIHWNDVITVSERAAGMGGSQVFLSPEEEIDVATLVKSIVVASGNDASVAMAEHIAGSEETFVQLMNQKAKELGMKNTHFVNSSGLDADGHMTTAYDVAIMSRELITRFPQIHEFSTIWHDNLVHQRKKGEEVTDLTNTNRLLKWYEGANGLKTGSTSKALYCLSGTAERNGLKLIAVVMAAPDHKTRFQEVMKMFDYGFANYEMVEGDKKGTVVGRIPLIKGMEEEVEVILEKEMNFLLKKGAQSKKENMEYHVETPPSIEAPVKAGDVAGEIIYKIEEKEIGRSPLLIKKDVQKANFSYMIHQLLDHWL